MDLGVCYYPEHWPEDTWEPDAARMKALGLRWVRVGEFAWSALEPSPDDLRFDWLDRAIDTLAHAGLDVVLGTPTATPPKWLVDAHPDILPVGVDGRVRGFGSRRHYCFNSATYRRETERIVTLLAERYGRHPAVRAWQTDNEYGCHDTVRCWCDSCAAAFRGWLAERYDSVDALNDAWWTRFWSQEYRSFEEVDPPNLTVTEPNPSHRLDYYRFASDSVVGYNRLQAGILRTHSDAPITHNAMGFFGDYDHVTLAADLDAITWDSYPLGMLEESQLPEEEKARWLRTGHPDLVGFNHDLMRGLKDAPFWVMEQQPGQVNWAKTNPLPADGAVRLWVHQAFAHGAEVVSWFRWRAARGAQELMHAGLNLHDGTPDRAAEAARQLAGEKRPERPGRVAGCAPARVALLLSYEDLWATQLQPHAEGWSYWGLQLTFYQALRALGLDVDVVPPTRDLDRYPLAFAPALHLVDEARADHLARYVDGGGHLVLGPRSGAKTPTNLAHTPAPGPLRALAGVRIDRVDALRPGVEGALNYRGRTWAYHTWADLLTPETAEPLATYGDPAYRNAAALTRNTHGNGACWTLGAWPGAALAGGLVADLAAAANLDVDPLPEGVRVTRVGRPTLLNFAGQERTAHGRTIPPYGAVFLDADDAS